MKIGDKDHEFASIAVAEARKSKSEPNKISPFVGAVAVRKGKMLGAAHRGELGEGNHAEFTLLEKKLARERLSGATIYTTLEPCTNRNHPKKPCCQWLIDRKVARVVIGTLDDNPEVQGNGERRLQEHGIEVSRFSRDLADELDELNRDFIQAQRANRRASSQKANASVTAGDVVRNIAGIWACQYRYPSKDRNGQVRSLTETQVVRFTQAGNSVAGSTIFSMAHPETFNGEIEGLFLTGTYRDSSRRQSYHGAFQFVISVGRGRMLGRWVGFSHDGTSVDSDEWRWDCLNDDPEATALPDYSQVVSDLSLFDIASFL